MHSGTLSLLATVGLVVSLAVVNPVSAHGQGVPEAPDPGQSKGQPGSAASREHPLLPAIALIKDRCIPALNQIQDYEALFTKRELIQGKLTHQEMQLRLREKPFSVYMRYGRELEGRETIYVEGLNNNNLLVHEGSGFASLAGTLSLDPKGEMVMAENHYPVTSIGMRKLVDQILEQLERETKYGEIEVKYFPHAKLGDRPCEVIRSYHPHARREFKFQVSQLFIDCELKLPVRLENYAFPTANNPQPQLYEEYTYSNIRVNVGLTDADFDRKNPKYKF